MLAFANTGYYGGWWQPPINRRNNEGGTVTTYDLAFVVRGIDVNNEQHIEALETACQDLEVYPGTDGTRTLIDFVVDADSDLAALLIAYEALTGVHCVSGVEVLSVDRDLVDLGEIAARVERTKESVRLLSIGARGDGTFPPHVGVVGNGTRVWHWADVYPWLVERGVIEDELRPVSVAAAQEFEVNIRTRRASTRFHRMRGAHWVIQPVVEQRLPVTASHGPTQTGGSFRARHPKLLDV